MMSIAMNIKYPDFFAASYLVACQWDATKTAPMAKNRLFVLISQNDEKAKPGQDAIMTELEKYGAVIKSAVLDAKKPETWNDSVNSLLSQGGNIHYMQVLGDTLPLEIAYPTFKGVAHMGTWGISYDTEAIREWLFRQSK